ncbi:purine nucleoside phosphorylase-like isoform X1 [Leptotrombidium deliense]|uniref:Purine nucleoside phosphorylase n=1 Tax=Leptotrombidium deliense TaxID=299467 RepID=A0A443SMP6_9ACAR|nr:purine nucleoside phosphorylase-like isoform X1 [Leptotrombidium deliense]
MNNSFDSSLNGFDYKTIEAIAKYILDRTKHRPKLGIICGSGLGGIAEQLDKSDVFPYESIPNFPKSTVVGHSGCLVIGNLKGMPTVCMKGRFHNYEGYPLWLCAMPVRVMKLLGINTLIVTNAAGAINPSFNVGDLMIIKDHINIPGFAGNNPLRGKNEDQWGTRFPAINRAYNPELIKMVKGCVADLKLTSFVREGVYCMLGGPSFETVAEIRALHVMGADAVGMSTVHEVIYARHCNIKVIGISLITNKCVSDWDSKEEANHEENIAVGKKRAKDMESLVQHVAEKLNTGA